MGKFRSSTLKMASSLHQCPKCKRDIGTTSGFFVSHKRHKKAERGTECPGTGTHFLEAFR